MSPCEGKRIREAGLMGDMAIDQQESIGFAAPPIFIFNKQYNITDLEVVEPFSIIDIYRKNPCQDEFLKLLEDGYDKILTRLWCSNSTVEMCPTLMNNLPWLVGNGFLREKNQETELKLGMKLARNGENYIITADRIINIKTGYMVAGKKYTTLERLNANIIIKFEISG